MITQENIRHFFEYDPETGRFDRIRFINNRGESYERRSPVTSKHACGYYMATIFGKRIRVHHLAFVYMMDVLPDCPVDHINGNRVDNRWCNLRLVTRLENQRNHGIRGDNRVGRTGVYWYPPLSKYQAQITVEGRRVHLGYHLTIDDAIAARVAAERQYGFHINHGARPSWRG